MAANRPYGDNDFQVNSMTVGDKRQRVEVEHESDLCLGSIYNHLVLYICYEILVNSITVNSLRLNKSPPKKSGRTMKKVKSNTRHSVITVEYLAHKMNIGLENANQMMRATTKKGV